MLISTIFSRGVKAQIPSSFQWINITIRLSSTSDSSSDSSDSDSNAKKQTLRDKSHIKGRTTEKANSGNELRHMMSEIRTKSFRSKPIDIAVSPRRSRFKPVREPKSYIEQLAAAAKDAAPLFKGDAEKTVSDLVNKTAQLQNKKHLIEGNSIIKDLLKESQQKEERVKPWKDKQSILYELKKIHHQKDKMGRFRKSGKTAWNVTNTSESIFGSITTPSQNIPVLNIWQLMEEREMRLLVTHPPRTYFQELIQWTDQGKIWKFPIDNEQGMEKEHNVHFSEHVFMERHLQGWCPKKGPIKHFMELVCVGLSKNPYMTVEEKIDHIMWYKQYFTDKEGLLQELGAIQTPISASTTKIDA